MWCSINVKYYDPVLYVLYLQLHKPGNQSKQNCFHCALSSSINSTCYALCLPLQVKLSRLCEQDKILKDLEVKISTLKDDKVNPQLLPPFLAHSTHITSHTEKSTV